MIKKRVRQTFFDSAKKKWIVYYIDNFNGYKIVDELQYKKDAIKILDESNRYKSAKKYIKTKKESADFETGFNVKISQQKVIDELLHKKRLTPDEKILLDELGNIFNYRIIQIQKRVKSVRKKPSTKKSKKELVKIEKGYYESRFFDFPLEAVFYNKSQAGFWFKFSDFEKFRKSLGKPKQKRFKIELIENKKSIVSGEIDTKDLKNIDSCEKKLSEFIKVGTKHKKRIFKIKLTPVI